MKFLIAAVTVMAAVSATAPEMHSRPRSAGGVFSFNAIELSYQHNTSKTTFYEINAGLDMGGVIPGRTLYPGFQASFSYNFIFWGCSFGSGRLSTYAGMGLSAGYTGNEDYSNYGTMAGLNGKLGLEYMFNVNVILSLDFTPVLGLHLDRSEEAADLDIYMPGLTRAYWPRLGIRFCF